MAVFGIEVEGLGTTIDSIATAMKVMNNPFEKIKLRAEGIIRRGVGKTIEKQDFAPLSPYTKAYKAAHGLSPKILIGATHNLKRVAMTSGSAYIEGESFVVPMDTVSVPYAAKHQFGIGVIARPFFEIDEGTENIFFRMIADAMAEEIQ